MKQECIFLTNNLNVSGVTMSFIKNADFIISKNNYGKICPAFLKEFFCDMGIKKATLQVSALGVYTVNVNNNPVGEDYILAPGWTAYQSRLQYQEYDITDLIKEDNFIEISLGKGWAVDSLVKNPPKWKPMLNRPAVIAAISVEYENGNTQTIYTDKSWKASKTEILQSDIYNGEIYDNTISGQRNWEDVELFLYPREILIPQEGELIKEIEALPAKEIIKTPAGETVIDFGQEITGYISFTPQGNFGDEIEIDHGEVLDKHGNFYNTNYRSAKAQVKYICSGNDSEYKAHHTFYGFRYIRINKWSGELDKNNFKAISVHSEMKRTGYFECSDPMVNKLYSNIIWSHRDNFLDVPTDCPQRDERLGWTGDANVFCKTAAYNYDVERFFKKWLCDLKCEQFANGGVPHVVPNNFTNDYNGISSSYWGDAAVVVPWEMYLAYGDKEFLKEQFYSMKRYVEHMRANGSDEYLFDTRDHFSDWLAMDKIHNGENAQDYKEMLATGAYANSTEILVKAGKVLGLDMSEYEQLYKGIVAKYNEKYVIDGDLKYKTQTMYVVALHFKLVENKPLYAKRLADLIKANGNRLTTGFVGTAYLMQALTENGYTDVAYSLLLQTEFPSWLFSVRMGATTIWEHWDSINENGDMWSTEMNSFNHYAYGAVASWMYGTMGGINYDESNPAYNHIIISPIPDKRIDWVKTSLETRQGTVKSSWKFEGDKVKYNITVPEKATATITIGAESYEVSGGEYEYIK